MTQLAIIMGVLAAIAGVALQVLLFVAQGVRPGPQAFRAIVRAGGLGFLVGFIGLHLTIWGLKWAGLAMLTQKV